MNVLLIEPILDRYVARSEKRERDWSAKEVEESGVGVWGRVLNLDLAKIKDLTINS